MEDDLFGSPMEQNIWFEFLLSTKSFDSYLQAVKGGNPSPRESILIKRFIAASIQHEDPSTHITICKRLAAVFNSLKSDEAATNLLHTLTAKEMVTLRDCIISSGDADKIRQLRLDQCILNAALIGDTSTLLEHALSILPEAVELCKSMVKHASDVSDEFTKVLADVGLFFCRFLVVEGKLDEFKSLSAQLSSVIRDPVFSGTISDLVKFADDSVGFSRDNQPMAIDETPSEREAVVLRLPRIPHALQKMETLPKPDGDDGLLFRFLFGQDRLVENLDLECSKFTELHAVIRSSLGDLVRIHETYAATGKKCGKEYFLSLDAALSSVMTLVDLERDGMEEAVAVIHSFMFSNPDFMTRKRVIRAFRSFFVFFMDFSGTKQVLEMKKKIPPFLALTYALYTISGPITGPADVTLAIDQDGLDFLEWMDAVALLSECGWTRSSLAVLLSFASLCTTFFTSKLPNELLEPSISSFYFSRLSQLLLTIRHDYSYTAGIISMQFIEPRCESEAIRLIREVSSLRQDLMKYFFLHPIVNQAIGIQMKSIREDVESVDELVRIMSNPEINMSNPLEVLKKVENDIKFRFLRDIVAVFTK